MMSEWYIVVSVCTLATVIGVLCAFRVHIFIDKWYWRCIE